MPTILKAYAGLNGLWYVQQVESLKVMAECLNKEDAEYLAQRCNGYDKLFDTLKSYFDLREIAESPDHYKELLESEFEEKAKKIMLKP